MNTRTKRISLMTAIIAAIGAIAASPSNVFSLQRPRIAETASNIRPALEVSGALIFFSIIV